MSDRDLLTTIGFAVDQASIDKAKRAINDTRDTMLKAADAAKAADFGKQQLSNTARAFDGINDAAKQAADAAQLTARSIADTRADALQDTVQGYHDIEKAARAAANASDSVRAGADAKRRTSEAFDSVGASGDIASATGGLRSGLDALGVSANGAAGRVLELAEAAGDLGEYAPILARTLGDLASQGGPATSAAFSALSSRIGDTGAKAAIAGASVGAAGLALAALSVAVQRLQEDAANAQKGISEAFSARDKVNTFRDSGGTEAQARAKIAQLQTELETARGEYANAEQTYAQAYKEVEASNGAIRARFGIAAGYFSEFQGRIDETSKRVQELTAEYDTFNNSLGAGKFAKDVETVGDAFTEQSRAAEAAAKSMEETSRYQLNATASALQTDEAMLAQHLSNESSLKASAYEVQIGMAARAASAAARVANGYRPLNTEGISNNTFLTTFGGLQSSSAPFMGREDALRPSATTNNTRANTYNVTINAPDEQAIYNAVGRLGLI